MSGQFKVRIVNIRNRHHNQPWADEESIGLFHFKHDLLGQIPVYLSMVKKMEASDPRAYDVYSKVGGMLLPPNAMLGTSLSDVDPAKIPSFACAMLGSGIEEEAENKDTIWPRLLYLQRMKSATGVQFSNGKLYSMTLFYARTDARSGVPVRYHVAVGDNGSVRLLQELETNSVVMRSKRGTHDYRSYKIPVRKWQVPSNLQFIATEAHQDVSTMAQTVFCFLAGIVPRMKTGFQVRAHRGGPRAVFNITENRAAHFFKDREVMLTDRGATKKIFHYVPGYQRMDGVMVRGHTKGLRDFDWNGYKIHIGVPGLDFPNVADFKAAAIDYDDGQPMPHGMVDGGEAADKISRAVESSSWWRNRKRYRGAK